MSTDPFGSRFIAGYDEPPAAARVRNLLMLTLMAEQPVLEGQQAPDGPRLVEFDFDPAHHDPIAQWRVVTTAERCLRCLCTVEAGEHVAITARGRRLCTECGIPDLEC